MTQDDPKKIYSRDDEFALGIWNILLMSFKDQSLSWNLRIWLFQEDLGWSRMTQDDTRMA